MKLPEKGLDMVNKRCYNKVMMTATKKQKSDRAERQALALINLRSVCVKFGMPSQYAKDERALLEWAKNSPIRHVADALRGFCRFRCAGPNDPLFPKKAARIRRDAARDEQEYLALAGPIMQNLDRLGGFPRALIENWVATRRGLRNPVRPVVKKASICG